MTQHTSRSNGRRRALAIAGIGLSTALALMGCVGGGDSGGEPAASQSPSGGASESPEMEPHSVSVMANWLPEASQGGYWQAAAEKLGEDQGLTIEVKAGGPGVQTVTNVAIGDADYGMTSVDNIYAARAEGIPLVGIFAPYQHSPQCFITHPSANIKDFSDLDGKNVAVAPAGNYWLYLKKKYDIKPKKEVPPVSMGVWHDDPNMAAQCFVSSEPFTAEENGWDYDVLMVSKAGYDPYTQVLFTTEKRLSEHPEEARVLVEASKKGWEDFVYGDPSAAIDVITSQNKDYSADNAEFAIEQMKKRDMVPETIPPMDPDRWKKTYDALVDIEAIDSNIDWQDAFSTDYEPN